MATRQYTNPSSGQSRSPFFGRLPAELRTIVYRACFSGSRAMVTREDHPWDNANQQAGHTALRLRTGKHLNLLLTCQRVYHEACSVYWEETTVVCTGHGLRRDLEAIPVRARAWIRMLEEVAQHDDYTIANPMPLIQFLRHFPQLVYCKLRRWPTFYILGLDDQETIQAVLRSASYGVWRTVEALDTTHTPVLVQKMPVVSMAAMDRVDWLYINHTAGRHFYAANERISDEEGFRRVTAPEEL